MSSKDSSPVEGRGMGLAVYTRDVDSSRTTRSFLFRDELVEQYSEDTQANTGRDDRSVCTLIEDCEHQERSSQACNCYKDTEIDEASMVYNGSIADGESSRTLGKHHLNGGSVKNGSKLVNGNLDREAFLAFFCNNSNERPATSGT
ncbi:uncharacterized protein N7496_005448 [Penicillium cataractarum]|uniref:Uncharacterized protein n=1 Tax=Penicillium cataractarum TaxID=2100454 RepID=A0A9W9VEP0_9EURO|nr:uncharacterized protein N7496_005448 [Penicillium cataractarum]KAJ5378039.1 hypothetical protein N7496_005448 [Penicillium cataractarum]